MTAKVEVRYPLPGNPPRAIWLTESLDDVLATYTLTELGRLMRTDWKPEVSDSTPPEKIPNDLSARQLYEHRPDFYDYQERRRKSLLSGRWPLELVSTAIVDTQCHGSWELHMTDYDAWGAMTIWSYRLKFEKGLLVSVEGGPQTTGRNK